MRVQGPMAPGRPFRAAAAASTFFAAVCRPTVRSQCGLSGIQGRATMASTTGAEQIPPSQRQE